MFHTECTLCTYHVHSNTAWLLLKFLTLLPTHRLAPSIRWHTPDLFPPPAQHRQTSIPTPTDSCPCRSCCRCCNGTLLLRHDSARRLSPSPPPFPKGKGSNSTAAVCGQENESVQHHHQHQHRRERTHRWGCQAKRGMIIPKRAGRDDHIGPERTNPKRPRRTERKEVGAEEDGEEKVKS